MLDGPPKPRHETSVVSPLLLRRDAKLPRDTTISRHPALATASSQVLAAPAIASERLRIASNSCSLADLCLNVVLLLRLAGGGDHLQPRTALRRIT
jgi:hypothetical protein